MLDFAPFVAIRGAGLKTPENEFKGRETMPGPSPFATPFRPLPDRRAVLTGAMASAAVIAAPYVAKAASSTIKIGVISNQTGPGAAFGEATEFALNQAKDVVKNGLQVGGKTYKIDFVFRDGQTSMNRNAAVAGELMTREGVDLLISNAGETPAASGQLATVNKVPLITTMLPSDAAVALRGGPEAFSNKGNPWNFNFLFDSSEIGAVYAGMWETVRHKTNEKVGTLYVDLAAARGFADPDHGFPAMLKKGGFAETAGGMFKVETDDFSNQVSAFKAANAQLLTGFMLEPNFATFWRQAAQAGFKPEVVTMAACFLFPSGVNALGDRGDGMSTEVWWSPKLPFKSSMTGQTARELATAWEEQTGKQWTPVLGYAHALFEITMTALKASADPKDKAAVRAALMGVDTETIIGPINWRDAEIKGIAKTPLVGGQWRKAKSGKYKYDLVTVFNGSKLQLPVEGDFKLLSEIV